MIKLSDNCEEILNFHGRCHQQCCYALRHRSVYLFRSWCKSPSGKHCALCTAKTSLKRLSLRSRYLEDGPLRPDEFLHLLPDNRCAGAE